MLILIKKILKTIHSSSCEFQNKSILLSEAINLVNSTKQKLLTLKSDTAFAKMHDKTILCANKNQINIKDDVRNNNSKRSQCYNRKLDEPILCRVHYWKICVKLNWSTKCEKRYFICDN